MLPTSSLSNAAYSLRKLFLQSIDELADITQIRIGHPADNIKALEDTDENCLNLFFYDVNYDGYPADGGTENPFYVRLQCLITAVGAVSKEPEPPGSNTERDVSKGENELRLVGEVMRILHEKPLLSIGDSKGKEVAVLQVVPHPMNLDNLNHIWSTQSDISYRLSLAYEMALAPVPQAVPAETSPLVGDSRMVVWGDITREDGTERDGIISLQPRVDYLAVDTGAKDWMPHICALETLDDAARKLHYVFRPEGDLTVPLDILIAGKPGGRVKLLWNVWRKKTDDSVVAWKENLADLHPPSEKTIKPAAGPPDEFAPGVIDPQDVDDRSVFQALLPADVAAADTASWQAVLQAVHEWSHPDPVDTSRNITSPIRSNTVLFYGGSG